MEQAPCCSYTEGALTSLTDVLWATWALGPGTFRFLIISQPTQSWSAAPLRGDGHHGRIEVFGRSVDFGL